MSDKRLRKISISRFGNWLISCKAQTRRSAWRQAVRAKSSVAEVGLAPGMAQSLRGAICGSISLTIRSSWAVISGETTVKPSRA